MAEDLVKPGVNPLSASYAGTIPCTIRVEQIRLMVQANFEDVTAGADTATRLAKNGLVNGRVLVQGFMAQSTAFTLATIVNEETSQGVNLTLSYGNIKSPGTIVLPALLEMIDMIAKKTSAFCGVVIAFRLAGTPGTQ